MSARKIIHIDQDKCDGCGQCATACAEGAIAIIDGKAKLVSEIYCDGLGACLGVCPQDAITIEEREAREFDEEATRRRLARLESKRETPKPSAPTLAHGHSGFTCPGSMARSLGPKAAPAIDHAASSQSASSQLSNWPVQLTLVPPSAPYLKGANILLAAHCAPFAFADFHGQFLKGRPVLIACPKLDDSAAHLDKLTQVLTAAQPASLTVIRMEVPCCSGLTRIAQMAANMAGMEIALKEAVIGVDGDVKSEQTLTTSAGKESSPCPH